MSRKNAIVAAACAWWKSLRPMGWNEEQHLADPLHGTHGIYERELAAIVAKYLRDEGK